MNSKAILQADVSHPSRTHTSTQMKFVMSEFLAINLGRAKIDVLPSVYGMIEAEVFT